MYIHAVPHALPQASAASPTRLGLRCDMVKGGFCNQCYQSGVFVQLDGSVSLQLQLCLLYLI